MRNVYILGSAQTEHGAHKDKTLKELINEAGNRAILESGLDRKNIEALYVSNYAGTDFNNQNMVGSVAATALGLGDKPAFRLEGACASGGIAFRQGYFAIASGLYDLVLVLGVEKMNTLDSAQTMQVIAKGGDQETEGGYCVAAPSMFAVYATRHMYEFGTTREQIAMVAEKNTYHGTLNPYAHKRKHISLDKILKAKEISSPLGLYDVSLVTDASAAIVLSSEKFLSGFKSPKIKVLGSGIGGDYFNNNLKLNSIEFPATIRAAKEAFQRAGIQRDDIDVLECHDCFTITEILNLEDLGFVNKGEGGRFVEEGHSRLGGKLPVNTSGGLRSKGHPIGATGIGQIVEMSFQLRETSGERQVKNARTALTHVLGGPGSISTIHIIQRVD